MQIEPQLLDQIREVIAEDESVTSAVLFGSRALGTASNRSDIDIALKGAVSDLEAERIAQKLEDDLPTLLHFDVVAYSRINLPALTDHIDRVGIDIYQTTEIKGAAKSKADAK